MIQKSSSSSGDNSRHRNRDPEFEARRAGDGLTSRGPAGAVGTSASDQFDESDRLSPFSILGVFVAVVVLMLVIQTFIGRLYVIPSASMEPTLHGCPGCSNDRIAVDKVSYRFGSPQPGDVVVFAAPDSWNADYHVELSDNVLVRGLQVIGGSMGLGSSPEHIMVKRVIAVGGQTVKCFPGDAGVMVDGQVIDSSFIQQPPANPVDFTVGSEACGGAYFGPIQVPADSLWLMGDNRTNSVDSRAHVGDPMQGTVPVDNVRGKVMAVVLPLGRFGTVDHVDLKA